MYIKKKSEKAWFRRRLRRGLCAHSATVSKNKESGIASQGTTKSDAFANPAETLEFAERLIPEDEDVAEDSIAPGYSSCW